MIPNIGVSGPDLSASQDPDSSMTLPAQHVYVDVSLEPQLNTLETELFYPSFSAHYFSIPHQKNMIPSYPTV